MTLSLRDGLITFLVAFVAWGLAVKWLPFLRLLGYAFFAGVCVALSTIAVLVLTTSRSFQDLQLRDRLSNANLAILSPRTWREETEKFRGRQKYQSTHLYPQSFVVSQALDGLISLVLRDFVDSWYRNISRSPVFVNEIEKNLRVAVVNLRDRLFKEDLVGIAVQRIVPIFTAHLRDFDQAERAVRGKSLNRNVTESEELDLAIAAKYRDGRLHPAAALTLSDTKAAEQEHLRKILVRILPDLVAENVMTSRAVSVLIKEIVACAVLYPLLQMLADPDTWNQLIEAYGRTTLQDRKTVRKMRAALDEHASPMPKNMATGDFPKLSPEDNERAFERFVRAIRRTNNLSDARRFRSLVSSQLKRESLVPGQDNTYLRRLETAKRVLDQKVGKLSRANGAASTGNLSTEPRNASNEQARELSLVQILHTAAGLSYFMEYMDRQRLMTLVQFWVVVDGFRNPLEDDFGDDETTGSISWTDTDRMDIAQISETYMSKREFKTPDEFKSAIKAFLAAGRKASASQYRAARTAVLAAQSAVYEELESKHFPSFHSSDLYYKFLASDEASNGTTATVSAAEASYPAATLETSKPSPAPLLARTSLHPASKKADLRRAALSSSDIRSMSSSKLFDDDEPVQTSLESDARSPLFDDGYDTDPLAHSTMSIGQESLNGDSNHRQVIENMEAAMNDIMTESPRDDILEDTQDVLFGSPISSQKSAMIADSPRHSLDLPRIEVFPGDRAKPNLATLGLVNTASRIGVFSDNDLFPDEEKFIEDEYAEQEETESKEEQEEAIHEAAPGDLGLAEAISALSRDIERLVSQESVVDTLTRKAELTNNVAELRILGKSKASLQREIRRKELQRQQYIVQESDNSLYGRSSIRIKSVMVGREDDGREYALYVIEVRRQAGDQMPAATWAIARRYSEFHDLHQRLRRRYPSTRGLEFPRRRVVMKLQKQFLQNRRVALEGYLQKLLSMPDVCRSRELRSFLSQQAIMPRNESDSPSDAQDIVTRIYNSVTEGMDDFLGNIAVIDQLSLAGQNLISAAANQMNTTSPSGIVDVNVPPGSVAEAEAELRAFEDRELEPFVKPICDIFLETFELNRGNNWLRGRAVVVVLHQLLGGTVERKVRDIVRQFAAEDHVVKYLDMMKESMWPGGTMRQTGTPRSAAEKDKSCQEAGVMLATLVPDLAGSVVGRANAQVAARRIMATMNNGRLNTHLVYSILDEIVAILFGGAGGRLG